MLLDSSQITLSFRPFFDSHPAIIYGGSEAPIAIELDHDQVMNMQAKAEFYSEVLTLVVDGK
ncbi:hypothetical protein ONQ87_24705, partial [Salmonella enterica subsp. enterica serovar Virginia]|nr:hypothetical protein [Salmonella enterica subsp. enterica serovar Virginia]